MLKVRGRSVKQEPSEGRVRPFRLTLWQPCWERKAQTAPYRVLSTRTVTTSTPWYFWCDTDEA